MLALALITVLSSGVMGFSGSISPAQGSTEDDGEIAIRTISTRYDREFQTFHVFGELENNLEVPVEKVRLNITFYDSQGNSTGRIVGSPYFDSLRPGERSAFDMTEQGRAALDLRDFAYYKISRTWNEAAEEKEGLLKIDVRAISADSCGYYRIDGTVTNLSRNYTSGLDITGVFYNEQGQVLATAITTVNERIDPTRFAEFTLAIEKDVLPHFAYYSLNVQSEKYSSASIEGDEGPTNFHDPQIVGARKVTVVADPNSYRIDEDLVKIRGQIPSEEVVKRGANTLVVMKIIGVTGALLAQVTSPVSESGSFSRDVDFQIDESMKGQVFRVRAEYFGMFAENTFLIENSLRKDEPVSCSEQQVTVSEVTARMAGSSANATSFVSGSKVKLGTEVTLAAIVDNQVSRLQNITMIFEVFDDKGIVIYLHAGKFALDPTTKSELRLTWVPEQEGTFVVKSFAVSTLERPNLLSVGPPLSVTVE